MPANLETLSEIREINASFPYTQPTKEWKDRGGRVVGWLCTSVPEEIIYAGGLLPIRVTGDSRELPLEDANSYFGINTCSFVRACFQLALDKQFNFLDAFVTGYNCEGTRYLADIWDHYLPVPLIDVLSLPRKFTRRAEEYYLMELVEFKQRLEQFFKIEISGQSLREAIQLYNRSRELLKQLYNLRKSDNPPISGAESLEVLNASCRMPKDQFNQLLERLLEEASTSQRAFQGKARLMISGSICNNPGFVKTIEDLGTLVVTDDLCSGARYFWDSVATNLDPLEAIAKRYVNKFPCARMHPFSERFNRVLELIRDFRVEGVIAEVIRYCNPLIHDQVLLTKGLEEHGIPVLRLDVEYGMPGTGQITTRVQAFIEMLQTRRAS